MNCEYVEERFMELIEKENLYVHEILYQTDNEIKFIDHLGYIWTYTLVSSQLMPREEGLAFIREQEAAAQRKP